MKAPLLLSLPLLLAVFVPRASATEQTIVGWDADTDYIHPMGLDPAIADPDFDTTWFLHGAAFSSYNGPAFGGPQVVGNAGDTTSMDSGTGTGPLGYEVIEYFTSGAPEVSTFGTTLTQPAAGNRRTAYFRIPFAVLQNFNAPRIRMILDDGALIYLDGVLVARVNKANNTEGYTQMASDTTATNNETGASANDEGVVQSFSLATAGTSTTADSFVIQPVSVITAGNHTLAISCRSNATSSSDMCMGLELRADDGLSPAVNAVASNIQRQLNGPGFADDTFSFDVLVTNQNFAGVVWNQTNAIAPATGPATGPYGVSVTYSGFPAQVDATTVGTASLNFSDIPQGLNFPLTVTAPVAAAGPLVLAPATPIHVADFEEDPIGSSNRVRTLYTSNAMGYDGNGKVWDDAAVNAVNGGTKAMRFVGIIQTMTTEAVGLDSSVKGIKASLKVRSFTTSGSTFEDPDSLRIILEGSADGTAWHELGSIMPRLDGGSGNGEGIDQLINKIGTGVAGNTGGVDVITEGAYTSLSRGSIAPQAGDAFVRVQVLHPIATEALSTSENFFIDDITLEIGTDPSADPDGDGYNNGAEDLAGTDPAVAASNPGIVTFFGPTPLTPGSMRHQVTFTEGNFRVHVLEASDDLSIWTNVAYYFGTTAGGSITQTDDSFNSRRFFRWSRRY